MAREEKRVIEKLREKYGLDATQSGNQPKLFCQAAADGYEDGVNFLVKKLSDSELEKTDEGHYTALARAVKGNYHRITKTLLDHGAEVEGCVRTSQGNRQNALQIALREGHGKVFRQLLDHCATKSDHSMALIGEACVSALASNNTNAIQLLFGHDVKNTIPQSSLRIACREGLKGTARLLVENEVSVSGDDNELAEAAVDMGDLGVLKYLKEKGLKVDRVQLVQAVRKGDEKRVSELLKKETDPNDKNQPLLHVAARHDKPKLIPILIKAGAEPEMLDVHGQTAINTAISRGHADFAKELINETNAGCIVKNNKDEFALHEAARRGVADIVDLLLEKDSEARTKSLKHLVLPNKDGMKPLLLAAEHGHPKAVEKLLAAKTSSLYDMWSRHPTESSPLLLAAENGHEEVVRVLCEHSVPMKNFSDSNGTTPLMAASKNRKGYNCVKLLLDEEGIDVNATDSQGNTALFYAIKKSRGSITELLLERGCRTTMRDDGPVVLVQAAEQGHKDIVNFLLDKGDSTETAASNGRTALSAAASSGHKDIVEMLVVYRADVRSRDQEGNTPLMLAVQREYEGVAKLLLKHGADIDDIKKDNSILSKKLRDRHK